MNYKLVFLPDRMVYLDTADRLLLIGGCCAFLLLILLIVVCKLTPWCWCYNVCPLRAKYDETKEKMAVNCELYYEFDIMN